MMMENRINKKNDNFFYLNINCILQYYHALNAKESLKRSRGPRGDALVQTEDTDSHDCVTGVSL